MTGPEIHGAARLDRVTVHLHGWLTLPDGSQEYSDDWLKIDGWSSYLRVETPDDPQQPFDIVWDVNHTSQPDAEARARELAGVFLGDPDEFHHD